jgi:hypothetical protein
MKYICLAYMEPGKLQRMTEVEQRAMLDASLTTMIIWVPTGTLPQEKLFSHRKLH